MRTSIELRKRLFPSMKVWFKYGTAETPATRTQQQKDWDSGVMAAAEYCRRLTGDETLSLALHDMLTACMDSANSTRDAALAAAGKGGAGA